MKDGAWRDVLLLERRSGRVGGDPSGHRPEEAPRSGTAPFLPNGLPDRLSLIPL
jgi:hypothetical protein